MAAEPSPKIVSLWSGKAGVGRMTLARALSQTWSDAGHTVLLVQTGLLDTKEAASSPPAEWVPKFKTLSPTMLRNFLAAPEKPYGWLLLSPLPQAALVQELLSLAARAYTRILFVGPMPLTEEAAPILDASDLLLWVSDKSAEAPSLFQTFLSQLSKLHFPHAFVHPVIYRAAGNREPPSEIVPGKKVLAAISEKNETGFRFQEDIRCLADLLESRSELSKPRRADDAAKKESSDHMIEQIRQQVQPQLLKALEKQTHLEAAATQETVEACLAGDSTLPASRQERAEILARVLNDVMGLGPLEPLLKNPEISEVMVNGPHCIYVEKKGKLHSVDVTFSSDKQLRTVIDRIVAPIGRRVDESMPLCDARLADGSRVNIVLPPLALDGASVTIRKFSARSLGFEDLVGFGSLSPAMADFLHRAVMGRHNIVVSGGTGSGKTTLLNALSSAIPDDERIVTIEDAAELKLQKPHVVRLESRPPNAEGEGAIPIRRLVINALRMRPDRIVVGECRGGEALDMLQAMNTGHDGSMTTVHANSPRDALGRIETLVLMAGMDLPIRVVREQIRSAVHLFIQQSRLPDGSRKVTSITEVTGMEGDIITTQELFRFRSGQFESTGLIPKLRVA